jgi:hypothetical protein
LKRVEVLRAVTDDERLISSVDGVIVDDDLAPGLEAVQAARDLYRIVMILADS